MHLTDAGDESAFRLLESEGRKPFAYDFPRWSRYARAGQIAC